MLLSLLLASHALAGPDDLRLELASCERIWNGAPHCAFTDLVRWGGRLVCTFRESDAHVYGRDGTIRVLVSDDGGDWTSLASIEEEGVDLRDPKLSVAPNGDLVLLAGGSVYEGRTALSRRTRVARFPAEGEGFGPLVPIELDPAIRSADDWLWRITWRGDTAWGVVYQGGLGAGEWGVHLVASEDAVAWRHVAELELDGRPNETTLRFEEGGAMVALLRREAGDRHGRLGRSEPPYEAWTWQDVPHRMGGPNLARLPGGAWIAATRWSKPGGGTATVLARIGSDGSFARLLELPSGRDTSYPGLLLHGGELLVSYYSGHEGSTAIYLARVRLVQDG